MGESVESQIFGIKEIYCPPVGVDPEIDIVAVHGLNGDALKTWTSPKSKICWLNDPDLLPKYMMKARILVWGYNANICSLGGKETARDRVLQHAQTLIQDLSADRNLENATEKPIIFLCASLGGIIVKRALAYSESRHGPKTSHLHSIYISTYGLLFFGTPHHGSSKAHLLSSLTKLACLAPSRGLQIEPALLQALKTESETLQNITDQFVPLMSRFRIVFYWETQKTDLGYTKDYIVEQTSAAPCMESTTSAGIAADHKGMCRFDSKSDQAFRNVVSELKRWGEEAPGVIGDRWVKSRRALKEERRDESEELLRGEHGIPERRDRSKNLLIEEPRVCPDVFFRRERDRSETIDSYLS
ncbi:hypothetical protein EJ08DRAFT_672080 [Tothia fuscella]|uniref:DUF676 domain-containing protein n=1 Tax=Tothia fuscella TaxID=1048955 RepID=A0A9P4TUK3_9PEZI|nr:hypothetical protein EJ08DRAFT_672080 [Tothia fuscella]